MKNRSFIRLLSALLCAVMLLCTVACDGNEPVDPGTEEENSIPAAYTLFYAYRDYVAAKGGSFSIRSSSDLQMGSSTVRVRLYAATDGRGVYQMTEMTSDTQKMVSSHAYTDGAFRSNGTVIPISEEGYRQVYSFPSLPNPNVEQLASATVYRTVGGFLFTASEDGATAGEFLLGVLGRELYSLYAQATLGDVIYSFHFDRDGMLEKLDIGTEMDLDGYTISITATVSYGDIGTAQPLPPAEF